MKTKIAVLAAMLIAGSAFGQTAHSITVTFTASVSTPSGASPLQYFIYEGTKSGGESATPLNSTGYSCTTGCVFVTTVGLVAGTTYYLNIKTYDPNDDDYSPASVEVSTTIPVPAPVAPVAPTNPVVTNVK